jgi:hypothetical protein
VQLVVLGFPPPDFHGEIIDELERLRQSDTVRVMDALAVYKDSGGELKAMHLSNLTETHRAWTLRGDLPHALAAAAPSRPWTANALRLAEHNSVPAVGLPRPSRSGRGSWYDRGH